MPERERIIEWAVKQRPQQLGFNGTSMDATGRALQETFGKFPLQLNKFEHETALAAMVAVAGDGAHPYRTLLDALRKFEELEVRLK
jgi:hypothetical protein